jgi:DNA-binding NtrC family response regulator
VERLVNLCPPGQAITSGLISPRVLAPQDAAIGTAPDSAEDLTLAVQTKALERRLVAAALQRTNGNQSRAARLLGITRNGLAGKLKKLGLEAT